jgi:DNA-binding PadR family transcriptional regulator
MFGDNFHNNQRKSRLFKKGDLKYVILDMVKDCPSHGYDITTVLEERFHGLYSPSAGSIYPILQFLESENFVTSCRKDGKNVYTITDEGKRFLKEEKVTTDKIKERFRSLWGSSDKEYLRDVRAILYYISEMRHIIGKIAVRKDSSKVSAIRKIMAKASADIQVISEEDSPK